MDNLHAAGLFISSFTLGGYIFSYIKEREMKKELNETLEEMQKTHNHRIKTYQEEIEFLKSKTTNP